MKSVKLHAIPRSAVKAPSKQAIRRAVASSTAIETGKSVVEIERMLRLRADTLRRVTLAP